MNKPKQMNKVKDWLKGKKVYKIEILYTIEKMGRGELQRTEITVNGKKTSELPERLEKNIVRDYLFRKL